MRPMQRRQFLKMVKKDGWVPAQGRGRAGHDIFVLGAHSFGVPRHCPVSVGVVRSYHQKMKEING